MGSENTSGRSGHCVMPLTEAEFNKNIKDERDARAMLDVKKYVDTKKPYILSTAVIHFGRAKADISSKGEKIKTHIMNFMQTDIIAQLERGTQFKGVLKTCGSSAEGIKVSKHNEFDFIMELNEECIRSEELVIHQASPQTFRPRHEGSNVREQSLFQIYFKHEPPEEWRPMMKCKECKTCVECQLQDHRERSLCARSVQNKFMAAVQEICTTIIQEQDENGGYQNEAYDGDEVSSGGSVNSDMVKEALVKRSGPAATVYTKCNMKDAPKVIALDLTLAIPLHRKVPYSWPLGHLNGIVLHDYVVDRLQGVDKCYLVPTGDYWRLTFVSHEKNLMRHILEEKNKKYCVQALKYMRDELSVTDDYESSLLNSYPLKVSFLKETMIHPDKWSKKSLGYHAISILGRIEEEKEMTSFYIVDDPIMPGNTDKSYVETRRIIKHMEDLVKNYGSHGRVHAILLSIMLLFQSIIFVASLATIFGYDKVNHIIDPNYPVLIISFTSTCLFPPIFGLAWVKSNFQNIVYTIFRIQWLYFISLLTVMFELAVAIAFLVDNSYEYGDYPDLLCTSSSSLECLKYCLMIVIPSGTICAVSVGHLLLVCIRGQECCKSYDYPPRGRCLCCFFCCEVVFYEDIYRDVCCPTG